MVLTFFHTVYNTFNIQLTHLTCTTILWVAGIHYTHLTDEEIESLVQESSQGLIVSNWRDRCSYPLTVDSLAWAFSLPLCIVGGFLLPDLVFFMLLPSQGGYPWVVAKMAASRFRSHQLSNPHRESHSWVPQDAAWEGEKWLHASPRTLWWTWCALKSNPWADYVKRSSVLRPWASIQKRRQPCSVLFSP